MGYFSLANRGDIYRDIEEAINEYACNQGIIVDTAEPETFSCFFCHPVVNGAMTRTCSQDIYEFLLNDFSSETAFFKRRIGKAYLLFIKHQRLGLGSRVIKSVLPLALANDILIYPANKKIKIFNFRDRVVVNVLKKGYSDEWFKKEIGIRINPKFKFIPEISSASENIYTENILSGFTLARISKAKQPHFLSEIEKLIKEMWYSPEYVRASDYTGTLLTLIINLLGRLRNDAVTHIADAYFHLSELLDKGVQYGQKIEIPIVFSHGDLQFGNIFIESERIWLIDWETYGRRSAYFDLFVLFYSMRSGKAFSDSIATGETEEWRRLKLVDSFIYSEEAITVFLSVFLLEDLIWHLEQIIVLPKTVQNNELVDYFRHYKERVNILINHRAKP